MLNQVPIEFLIIATIKLLLITVAISFILELLFRLVRCYKYDLQFKMFNVTTLILLTVLTVIFNIVRS